MFGSTELALERGYGLCLLYNDELLCEAFAGPSAAGLIEIGAESHPRHMHKGYATLDLQPSHPGHGAARLPHLLELCERVTMHPSPWHASWDTVRRKNII